VNTVIDASVEKVWEFVSDLGTATLRDPSVVKVDWQPPAGIGTVAMITHRFLGNRTARYEIKEWEHNHKFRAQITSMGGEARRDIHSGIDAGRQGEPESICEGRDRWVDAAIFSVHISEGEKGRARRNRENQERPGGPKQNYFMGLSG